MVFEKYEKGTCTTQGSVWISSSSREIEEKVCQGDVSIEAQIEEVQIA
jgi:hypothetical protein